MDRPQDSKDKLQRGRRLGRGVWISYLTTGAVLAILRVALFVRLIERSQSAIGWSRIDQFLMYCGLYAEYLLAGHTRLGEIEPRTEYFLVWGSLLTLTSFVMATPILLVGWLVRRRR